MQIGKTIAKYRKQAGLTQEQLGEAVCVSGQAVSKWENGGVPDTFLIPKIAQVLDISTDIIFGIENSTTDLSKKELLSVVSEFSSKLADTPEFFDFLFELIWSAQSSYWGTQNYSELEEAIERNVGISHVTSQIIDDYGTTYFTLVKDFPFFCAVKDDEGISRKLLSETEFDGLFSLLADEDGRRAVFFTQMTTETNQYTANGMAEKIGIDKGKFEAVLPQLVKYGLLHEDSLTLGGQKIAVYHKRSNPEIRPLLMLAYQFINTRQCYYNFTCNRTKAYF